MSEILISDYVSDFVKYFKANPGWGVFHNLLDDGNFEGAKSISELVKEESPRNKTAIRLAEAIEKMEPWQVRRVAEEIPAIAKDKKYDLSNIDDEPRCGWCGGDVDEDGSCLLDYCKGNR